jgi:hypothetical protein
MLRFVPDTWLDGLLRPFLLADPVAGLYSETQAPDWRFAALLLLLAAVALTRWRLAGTARAITRGQGSALLGLMLGFYVWTAVSGNARYYFWGLMLVGPLVVMVAGWLPLSRFLKNAALLLVVAVQGFSVWATYETNVWALRPWHRGPGLDMEPSAVAEKPAVFLTIGAISHSILVPFMHPQSRWSNVSGQQDLVPGMRQYERLMQMLDSPLPKYGVIRASRLVLTDDKQPTEQAWAIIRRAFLRQGLAPTGKPCDFVRAGIGGLPFEVTGSPPIESGFWFCEIERVPVAPEARTGRYAPQFDDVFAQIERRCPRFFPENDAHTRPSDEGVVRLYARSDTTVYVTHSQEVYFKNMRSLNPTRVGTIAEVREGRFTLECTRLPGRYQPPWERS